jgi:hypothetical protein
MASIVLSMIECMGNAMEVSMGEAKRRKALGLESAQGDFWEIKKRCSRYYVGLPSLEPYVQAFMDITPEAFRLEQNSIIPIEFALIGELLKRSKTSSEWERKRDHVAKVIGAATDLVVVGGDPKIEEIQFLAEARGDSSFVWLKTLRAAQ